MKRALAKILFPKLHRFDALRRMNTVILICVCVAVAACGVVALFLSRNLVGK